ncbi:glycosyltransferase [Gelidibacter gilvus]|uniref:Glycosyltransferase n=1 Tax=Gelidibacter gilvus TaxID=59602 RepID=A0A4Q0XD40_9FLAO|nr:glycosyltransferase [Gelidibacter gilvus]RXJ45398.1 glycosyltransferase [Gelidibacter gilvus]
MKTICFVVPSFPSVTETFVTNHIIQAKIKGYRVNVLTKNKLGLEASSQQELLAEHRILDNTFIIDFKIPRNKTKRRFQSLILILKFFKYWKRTKDISIRERFSTLPFKLNFYNQLKKISVFHIQFGLAGFDIALMKSIGLLSGQIITTFHGYDAHFHNSEELRSLIMRYKRLMEESGHVTVNTPYLANKVKLMGCDYRKLRIIPMGVDLNFFQHSEEKKILKNLSIKLISVGRLIELKGFEYAIRSIKLLVENGYNIKYTIVGEGQDKEILQQLVSKLNIEEFVFIVGAKNQNEIKELLIENNIFLMSSITDSANRAEAQGVVTAEAQAMGLPVVAFRSGGVPYTILENKTGYLIDEKNIEKYAAAIMKLVENPVLYKKMSISAKHFASNNFNRKTLSSEFFGLYV